MELFVVQVTHTTGAVSGVTEPILLATNPAVALTAAFGAHEKGYVFASVGDNVAIFRLGTETVRAKEPFRNGVAGGSPETLVFQRILKLGGWDVSWVDPELEQRYRKIFDALPVPA